LVHLIMPIYSNTSNAPAMVSVPIGHLGSTSASLD